MNKMENLDEYVLDYHEFCEEFKEGNYLSMKIDDVWLVDNESCLKEILFNFYLMYSKHTEPSSVMRLLFKLYSEVVLSMYNSFSNVKFLN